MKPKSDPASLVLLDTSAWILALRRDAPPAAKEVVGRLIVEAKAATTGLVVVELLSGTRTDREFQELAAGLSALTRLDPSPETWEQAARFAFRLRREGVTVPATDVLIMTVAWEHGCLLLHADRHFDLMAEAGVGLGPERTQSLLKSA